MVNAVLSGVSARYGVANHHIAHGKFLASGRPIVRALLEGTILYDSIVVPTNDFLCLPVLVGVLGERPTIELMDQGILRFARYKGSVAYVGGGVGMAILEGWSEHGEPKVFCSPTESAALQSANILPDNYDRKGLAKRAIAATTEFDLDSKTLIDSARREAALLSITDNADEFTSLRGIDNNQVRVFSDYPEVSTEDRIDDVLAIAHLVIDAMAADKTSASDVFTTQRLYKVLSSKIDKTLAHIDRKNTSWETFNRLRTIDGIPDIAECALGDPATILQLIRLSRSEDARQFRDWFHMNCRDNLDEAVKQFIEILKYVPKISRTPAKRARFAIDFALGVLTVPLNPLLGLGVGAAATAIDHLLVDSLFRGHHPKFFVEDLRQLSKPKKN